MCGRCSINEGHTDTSSKFLLGGSEEKRTLERDTPVCRWEDNVKMNLELLVGRCGLVSSLFRTGFGS